MMWKQVKRICERLEIRAWLGMIARCGGKVILCAGMPRSGSTWLFNAARLLLESAYPGEVAGGWIGDFRKIRPAERVLVKVHEFDRMLARNATVILYSYRDLRDALASSQRMFKQPATLALAKLWIRNDEYWRRCAAYMMRYETMRGDPLAVLHRVAETLRIAEYDAEHLLGELSRLRSPTVGYDPVNLLHPGHITDGRHGSWQYTLPPELVSRVEAEFASWFVANGYPLSPGRSVAAPPESSSLARVNT